MDEQALGMCRVKFPSTSSLFIHANKVQYKQGLNTNWQNANIFSGQIGCNNRLFISGNERQ